MVQWLGFSAFTATAQVQSLVEELRFHKPRGTARTKQNEKTRVASHKAQQALALKNFTRIAHTSNPKAQDKQPLLMVLR